MDAEIVLCFTDNGEIDFAVVKASDANDFGTERLIALTDKKHSVKCGDIRTFKGEIICKRTAKEIITIVNDYYGIRHGDDFEYKKRFDEKDNENGKVYAFVTDKEPVLDKYPL